MLAIGKTYELTVASESPEGYSCNYEDDKILINTGFVVEPLEVGQKVKLFVYDYKEPNYIGSLKQPKAMLGQFTVLEVKAKSIDSDKGPEGDFDDWYPFLNSYKAKPLFF